MKKLIDEFRAFISRGNVLDMAVGIIVGGAFTAIVNGLVDDIINPLFGIVFKMDFSNLVLNINGAEIRYGSFIMAIINFLLIALVLFLVIKGMNTLQEASKKLLSKNKKEEKADPTTKICPYCKSEIAIDATRCPHCTSEQPEQEEK